MLVGVGTGHGRFVGSRKFAAVRLVLRVGVALSPPVPEDTWGGRAVAPPLLLLSPPYGTYGAFRSGTLLGPLLGVPSISFQSSSLPAGRRPHDDARAKQLEGQCDQFRKDGLDGLGLAGLAGSGPRARTERSEKGEKEEH